MNTIVVERALMVTGRIDNQTWPDFEKALREFALANPTGTNVVDFAGVPYISSNGLKVLQKVNGEISRQGGKITLRNLKPNVKEIFDTIGFTNLFTIE